MIVKNNKALIVIIFLFIFISFLFYFLQIKNNKKEAEVDFLDVGQGDAILIKTPFGQNILIDGGDGEQIIKRLSEELSWWDRKIDLMILTHPHSDHVGGLVDVLKRYTVSKILYTGATHNAPDYIEWLRLVKDKKINLNIINCPEKIILGENCFLEIIYPIRSSDILKSNNLNNTSIVARFNYKNTSFLLVGDAEREVEEYLLKNKVKLKSDVLKVGHHGSDTSSAINFLSSVDPTYAVIEVGENNEFGHPSPRIINRLKRLGINIFRTDKDGSIEFVSDGERLKIIK